MVDDGGQWETTATNNEGRWRLTVISDNSGGNGQWQLATTSGGSHCRKIMQVMVNNGG